MKWITSGDALDSLLYTDHSSRLVSDMALHRCATLTIFLLQKTGQATVENNLHKK
jgi:hypothetical protein